MKKNLRAEAAERITELLDFPAGIISGLPRIEINGGRQVVIERHMGIIEYSREEILVNSLDNKIKIRGKGLEIRVMNAEVLLITGNIFCVEF